VRRQDPVRAPLHQGDSGATAHSTPMMMTR
jgi:hypothetical protein